MPGVHTLMGMQTDESTAAKKTTIPTVSSTLEDGTIIELLYRAHERQMVFAVYNAGRWTLQPHIDLDDESRLTPFSPNNNLIKNEVVLLPSEPKTYGSEEKLLFDIRSFIHRYVDLSPTFE